MNSAPKPFDCTYSPHFAELLFKLGISLAISTYQAGKIVILSAHDNDKLIQLTRNFATAMGMAVANNKLAVSTGNEVIVLKNQPKLAHSYPNKPNVYDGIFIPRIRYNTGYLSLHDMAFINDKLMAVNTLFSCLSYIDGEHSFTPFWQPPFITELSPEDRCHLNGIAIENNEIKYLTALGNTNTIQGWRDNKMNGGIVMEYPSGKIITDGLAMPHSPRIYNGELYLLNSAQGELVHVNTQNGTYETVVNLGGFARGMARFGDYLFIGVSKLRHNSEAFKDLPIAQTSFAGVVAVYLPYKTIVADFKYEMSVDEIYDVKVIENALRPSIISPDMPIHGHAISTPTASFWSKPKSSTSESKNNTSENQTIINQLKFHNIPNIEAENTLEQFKNLIYPLFHKKVHAEVIKGELISIVALLNDKPTGLVISELKPDNSAELHSIGVLNEFQKQGIAHELLKKNDELLIKRKIQYIDATWSNIISCSETLIKLLKKANWLQPEPTVINIKLDVKKAFEAKWTDKTNSETDSIIDTINFGSISGKQKRDIVQLINTGLVPPHLSPFQLPEIIDNNISKALVFKHEVVGWCIVHKLKPDTVQGSSIFIKKEFRNTNTLKSLIYNVFKEVHKQNIPFFIYQTSYRNQKLSRFLNGLTMPNAIVRKYVTLASRKYYKT